MALKNVADAFRSDTDTITIEIQLVRCIMARFLSFSLHINLSKRFSVLERLKWKKNDFKFGNVVCFDINLWQKQLIINLNTLL